MRLTKRAKQNLLLSILSAAMTVCALEAFARTAFSEQHVLGVWPLGAIAADDALNAAGFRDIDHDPAERRPTILVVGDSVTYGYAVPAEASYPYRLRAALPETRVVIAARPGASTREEIGFVRDYGCAFHPEVVLLMVVDNDPEDVPGAVVQGAWARTEPRFPFGVLRVAHAVTYYTAAPASSYEDWLAALWGDPAVRAGWRDQLATLHEQAEACGAERTLAAVYAPSRYHDAMRQLAVEAGWETVDLSDAYQAAFDGRDTKALPNDGHPNAAVHAWYAAQLRSHLLTP